MPLISWLEIAGGIALLFAAGEACVRGAVGLAKRAGVSPLLIGLTVVALGTSSPEFFVSLEAVLGGKAQIAIATVTGSNLIALTLVLGIASMFAPLVFSRGRFAFESAALVGSAMILAILALVGAVGRVVGIAMVDESEGTRERKYTIRPFPKKKILLILFYHFFIFTKKFILP